MACALGSCFDVYKRDILQTSVSVMRNGWRGCFGFRLTRIRGAHHIYSHPDLPAIINLQDVRGHAKPYQIRQLLSLVKQYRLSLEGGNS